MARPHVGRSALFIADANVLIDYRNAGLSHLGRFARDQGPVYVLTSLLRDEVRGASQAQCRRAGLTITEASIGNVLEAGQRASGSLLSFYDWLCLLEAKARGATCLTNDRALLGACAKEDVATRRGLWPLLQLVERGLLSARQAKAAGQKMAAANIYRRPAMSEFEAALEKPR